jgi:hypothetical protein
LSGFRRGRAAENAGIGPDDAVSRVFVGAEVDDQEKLFDPLDIKIQVDGRSVGAKVGVGVKFLAVA